LLLLTLATSAAHALTPVEQAEMVDAHNRWRRELGVPEVRWSANLAASAQHWADSLRQDQQCRMAHSGTRGLGENLYWASPLISSDGKKQPQPVSAGKVADAWASEKRHYDYAGNRCAAGHMCGHYTQMVWLRTTDIGCAKAACANHAQVWVCHYAPPGNWRGQKPF
jgi:pathogenesis-related protein 1